MTCVGAIGHLSSAATVAASSFGMKITDPRPFLDEIDQNRLREALGGRPSVPPGKGTIYLEPGQQIGTAIRNGTPEIDASSRNDNPEANISKITSGHVDSSVVVQPKDTDSQQPSSISGSSTSLLSSSDVRKGKIQRLGDFIDTDAVSIPPLLI